MMEQDVTKLLLVGLSKAEFVAYSIWALAGMFLSFGWSVRTGIRKTKESWSWLKFWSGWKRIAAGLISVAAGVIFFEKLAGFMLDSETPIQLTQWGAFTIVGLGSDRLSKVFTSFVQGKK